jgi:hypothetical protein
MDDRIDKIEENKIPFEKAKEGLFNVYVELNDHLKKQLNMHLPDLAEKEYDINWHTNSVMYLDEINSVSELFKKFNEKIRSFSFEGSTVGHREELLKNLKQEVIKIEDMLKKWKRTEFEVFLNKLDEVKNNLNLVDVNYDKKIDKRGYNEKVFLFLDDITKYVISKKDKILTSFQNEEEEICFWKNFTKLNESLDLVNKKIKGEASYDSMELLINESDAFFKFFNRFANNIPESKIWFFIDSLRISANILLQEGYIDNAKYEEIKEKIVRILLNMENEVLKTHVILKAYMKKDIKINLMVEKEKKLTKVIDKIFKLNV